MPSLRSLRFQLPLSYAAIALVATLVLGAVLLFTLRRYYQVQERAYLQENALAMSYAVSEMVASSVSNSIIEAQVKSLSLLTLARIRVLGPEGTLLADSGVPDVFQITSLAGGGGPTQIFIRQGTIGDEKVTGPVSDFVIIRSDGPPPNGIPVPFEQSLSRYPPPGEGKAGSGEGGMGVVSFAAPAIGTLYGYNLSTSTGDANVEVQRQALQRSDERVIAPLINQDGGMIGQLQLSDGPAYGREIVNSVARAWTISGLLAVILAAGVGGLVSRRMAAPVLALTAVTSQMAGGDLSARATVNAPEELAELGHSFNEMAERIEELVSTLRNFVSDAAHELHTPLTALRTDLELASETHQYSPALVERALNQTDRLQVLVNSLLNLSRIEAQEHIHTDVNLIPLLQEMGEMYASRAEQAGISFTTKLADSSAIILGNEAQLRSAIGNLLDNALKFSTENGQIHLMLTEQLSEWEISIADNGIGVPPEEIPNLFRRFHRARSVSEYPGNGLGLAIVKAIVDAHDGRVGVENLNPGAKFSIWLPR